MDTNQTQETNTQENPFPIQNKSDGSYGPIIGGIIALIAISGIAYYMISGMEGDVNSQQVANTPPVTQNTPPITTETPGTQDAAVAALSMQGNSDDLDAIEADINATNLDSVNEYVSQM